jgi:hypothetical protein
MEKVAFFVLCFLISIVTNSQNLIINSGFEDWSKADKPAGWTNTQGCLKDSVFIQSGTYSCRQAGTTVSRDLGQKIVVMPNTRYRFSFYYKTGAETTGNGCRVWCSWLDISQTGISDPVVHSGYLKSENWQKYETEVTSPERAGYFYLIVRTLPNSVTYWDDFLFEEDIVSSEVAPTIPQIKVYPNPAHDYLTISNVNQLQQIDIQNITGYSIWSKQFYGEEEVSIPVSGLKDGIYIIKISTSEKVYTQKFMKD